MNRRNMVRLFVGDRVKIESVRKKSVNAFIRRIVHPMVLILMVDVRKLTTKRFAIRR